LEEENGVAADNEEHMMILASLASLRRAKLKAAAWQLCAGTPQGHGEASPGGVHHAVDDTCQGIPLTECLDYLLGNDARK
jgi:hypothetical protein